MVFSCIKRIAERLEKLPFIGILVRRAYLVLDYAWSLFHLTKWVIFKEVLTPHLGLNLYDIPLVEVRVAVLTGGTRGIGKEIVRKLLQVKMHVIVGCRNPKDGIKLLAEFRQDGIITGTIEFLPLDLCSFYSVRKFSQAVLKKNVPIHLLINNAGVMAVPFQLTDVDRHETHFQVNYLSHFLLINLLLPNMIEAASDRKAPIGRIVNVSAAAMYYGKLDLDDLESRKRYSPFIAYFNSKLYQVLMSRHLDAKLQNDNAKVRVNSVHPGVVATELVGHISPVINNSYTAWIMKKLLMTPEEGAEDVLHVALTAETSNEGGEFYVHKKICTNGNEYFSPRLQRRLWEISTKLVGLDNH